MLINKSSHVTGIQEEVTSLKIKCRAAVIVCDGNIEVDLHIRIGVGSIMLSNHLITAAGFLRFHKSVYVSQYAVYYGIFMTVNRVCFVSAGNHTEDRGQP